VGGSGGLMLAPGHSRHSRHAGVSTRGGGGPRTAAGPVTRDKRAPG
jgi:hypothetical protein